MCQWTQSIGRRKTWSSQHKQEHQWPSNREFTFIIITQNIYKTVIQYNSKFGVKLIEIKVEDMGGNFVNPLGVD